MKSPLQRDTDADGIGNACDPDFDQNGIVDEADRRMMLDMIQRLTRNSDLTRDAYLRARDFDLNDDGKVDDDDLKILNRFRERPPGPRRDVDRDGVADMEDRCGNTPRHAEQVVPGCAAIELARDPELITASIVSFLSEVADGMRTAPELREATQHLDCAFGGLGDSAVATRRGDPCAGERFAIAAEEALRGSIAAIHTVMVTPVDSEREELPRDMSRESADHDRQRDAAVEDITDDEIAFFSLLGQKRDVEVVLSGAEEIATAFGALCRAARPFSRRTVVIRKFHDGGTRAVLQDGSAYAVSQHLVEPGILTEGVETTIDGYAPGIASGFIAAADTPLFTGDPTPDECAVLRFAPIQRMAPLFSGPYLLHELRAPRGGRVELGVAKNSCQNHNCNLKELGQSDKCGSYCCPPCCRTNPPSCPNTQKGLLPECPGRNCRAAVRGNTLGSLQRRSV